MSWNIHHGEGMDGRVDLQRVAEVIRVARADLVGLQEVDRGVRRTGGVDLAAELARLTGMVAVFSNNYHFQGGEYGNAILSRLPVTSWTNRHFHMLRSGEQRGLLEIRVPAGGKAVRFLTTHLDYRREDAERLSNVEEIRRVTRLEPELPLILCGDFNDIPGSRMHERLGEWLIDAWDRGGQGSGRSYPARNPERRIDYVFVAPTAGMEVRSARVIETDASDHRPLVVEVVWSD
jgi:endonuclease/exonuclease/phosphatase family metal-dependent hydrolase